MAAAVTLSQRYVPRAPIARQAVSLLDTACARVAVSQHATPAQVEDRRRRVELLMVEEEIIARAGGPVFAPTIGSPRSAGAGRGAAGAGRDRGEMVAREGGACGRPCGARRADHGATGGRRRRGRDGGPRRGAGGDARRARRRPGDLASSTRMPSRLSWATGRASRSAGWSRTRSAPSWRSASS
ncbi:hypothetical protein AB5I41_09270 [Sphingomonas sp. MMS24-JH45]